MQFLVVQMTMHKIFYVLAFPQRDSEKNDAFDNDVGGEQQHADHEIHDHVMEKIE